MLSTPKSANIGFLQVVQFCAPPATFYKFEKKNILGVNNVRTNIRI